MRLFRSFRKIFINEGKTRRYLLYAVGEILLVMIGIVLAFQVDNWNDRRLKRKSEQIIYQNIFEQLQTDREALSQEMQFDSVNRVYIDFIYQTLVSNDRTHTDSIGKTLGHLMGYSDYDKQSSLYSSMVSNGEIKLVTERAIITGLRELEEQFIYLNRMEEIHYDLIIRWLSPQLNEIVRFSTGQIKDEEKLYHHILENTILSTTLVMDEKKRVYEETIIQIDLLLADLTDIL